MKNKALAIHIAIAGLAHSGLSYGDNDITLCRKDEDIYFSCKFANEKIVSMCAKNNTSPDSGYVQYRYGNPKNIELIHPKTKLPPKDIFFYVNASEGSANKDILKFKNGSYTYITYQSFFSGLTILKNGTAISRKKCEPGRSAFISPKANSGIEEIKKSNEDYN